MISKLPKWVWAGAGVLSFCAGMVNVIAILGFVHKGITHVTGSFSLLSISVIKDNSEGIWQAAVIIAAFLCGAIFSGIVIGDARLQMGRRYGFALAVESALLLVATYGFTSGEMCGEYFASMAAGLQNAMASTFSGAIVRTTHLTGVLTDIGSLIGNKIRGLAVNRRAFSLLLAILLSFTCGSLVGATAYHYLGPLAMLVPAAIVGFSAVGYEVFRQQLRSEC